MYETSKDIIVVILLMLDYTGFFLGRLSNLETKLGIIGIWADATGLNSSSLLLSFPLYFVWDCESDFIRTFLLLINSYYSHQIFDM